MSHRNLHISLCILYALLLSCGTFAEYFEGNLLTGGKIINGTLAKIDATRHQVSIRLKLNDGYFFGTGHRCGGSLIAPNLVLSAAHCFVDYDTTTEDRKGTFLPAEKFIAVMGNLDRFVRNEFTISLDIKEIIYDLEIFDLATYDRDIALLILSDSVPANHATVKPIILNHKEIEKGTICQVTGWGETEDGYLSDYLMSVDVPIIDFNVCATESDYGPAELILAGMMCAGYLDVGERDACGGDSGGPMVCQGQQAGITSWGTGCAQPNKPGVYTDVAYYAKWIEDKALAYNITLPKENNTAPGGNNTNPGGNNTSPGGNNTKPGGGGAVSQFNGSLLLCSILMAATMIFSSIF